jgi:superfamily II DNA helicase RecQ
MKSSHTVQGANKEIFSAKNCLSFLVCLHVAIINSLYSNIVLKPKQVFTLEKIFMGKDVLGALPTGYGNSLIFHLLPVLLF